MTDDAMQEGILIPRRCGEDKEDHPSTLKHLKFIPNITYLEPDAVYEGNMRFVAVSIEILGFMHVEHRFLPTAQDVLKSWRIGKAEDAVAWLLPRCANYSKSLRKHLLIRCMTV